MVSRYGAYEQSWNEFVKKVAKFSPSQRRSMMREAEYDVRLTMIDGLARGWITNNSRNDPMRRLQQRQARMAEERRMAIDTRALRAYIDPATRAMLPAIRVRRQSATERRSNYAAASRFWSAIESGSWKGRSIDAIILQCSRPGIQSALAHPYGPPVEHERLSALRNDFRRIRFGRLEVTRDEVHALWTPQLHKEVAHMLACRG